MQLTIEFEDFSDLKDRLQSLLDGFGEKKPVKDKPTKKATSSAPEPEAEAVPSAPGATTAATTTEVPEEKKSDASSTVSGTTSSATAPAAEDSEVISDEALRSAAAAAARKDKEKVRALVNKYAPNVTAIPADKRAEFIAELAGV